MTFDINASIGPILDGVAALVPSILNLVINLVPLAIVGGVIALILGIFQKYVKM